MSHTRSSESMARRVRSRRMSFLVRRYLPRELVGLIAMLVVAQLTALVAVSAPIIAVAALAAGAVGCSLTMGMTVYREQRVVWGRNVHPRACAVMHITARQLVAELGTAGLIDFLVLRPMLLVGAILLVGNIPTGLIVGTTIAVLFAIAVVNVHAITAITSSTAHRRA
jgi:hypothetical protein